MSYAQLLIVLKGGPTSGNWGHAGRLGKRGGSAPQSGVGAAMSLRTGRDAKERQEAKRAASQIKVPINQSNKIHVLSETEQNYTKEQLNEAVEGMKFLTKDADVSIRVPEDVITKIIKDGKFKNQHETGTSMGALNPTYRRDAEQNAFGYDLEKPEDFPIYGYMGTMKNGYNPGAGGYGNIRITLKDSVKARTTITAGDSLGYFSMRMAIGTPLLNIGAEGLDHSVNDLNSAVRSIKKKQHYSFGFGYVEAQIHGGLTTKDIKHVYVPDTASNLKEIQSSLTKAGIPHTVFDAGYGGTDPELLG